MASLEELRGERMKKIERLRQEGVNPYPISSHIDTSAQEARDDFAKYSKRKKGVVMGGRVMSLRRQGGLIFCHFDDGTGRFQAMLKKDLLGEEAFTLFVETVDGGDFVEFTGGLFETKRNEKSVEVKEWRMLAKALRPLPDKWHGLSDTEERFRKRYLDTLMNEEVKKRFVLRSKLVSFLRRNLDARGFLEVETPILQSIPGGASAEPFVTHHNALDIDLYLRIAPELYLKELLIGGFPKVYEIGRLFRNEGIDVTHNPEFTTIELYEAYADADTHMNFVEELTRAMVQEATGTKTLEYAGSSIDFTPAYPRVPFLELIKRYALIPHPEEATIEELLVKAKQFGAEVRPTDPKHKILDAIYKKACKPKLIQPTFIVDYPAEFSPLAKRKEDNEDLIDRYQLVIGGLEVVNAFSELNDPKDQRARFLEQEKNKEMGDREAQPKDESYIEAMEYGLPPAAGLAISIDRMVMLLTDAQNIREVILFPTLRPKQL